MKQVKFTDLYKLIHNKSAILKRVNFLIKKSQFIGGKEVLNFENNFSKYVNSKYCVSVANGTDALEIALESLDIPKNSEVIVPNFTFLSFGKFISSENVEIPVTNVSPTT